MGKYGFLERGYMYRNTLCSKLIHKGYVRDQAHVDEVKCFSGHVGLTSTLVGIVRRPLLGLGPLRHSCSSIPSAELQYCIGRSCT